MSPLVHHVDEYGLLTFCRRQLLGANVAGTICSNPKYASAFLRSDCKIMLLWLPALWRHEESQCQHCLVAAAHKKREDFDGRSKDDL